jgi:hypothetical protein
MQIKRNKIVKVYKLLIFNFNMADVATYFSSGDSPFQACTKSLGWIGILGIVFIVIVNFFGIYLIKYKKIKWFWIVQLIVTILFAVLIFFFGISQSCKAI